MRLFLLLVTTVAATQVVTSREGDEEHKGLEQLRGSWQVVKAEPSGHDGSPLFEPKRLAFNGNKVTAFFDKAGKQKKETRVKVNPKAKPAQIDMQRDERAKDAFLGIYEVSGDTLRICFFDGPPRYRPTEFKALNGPEARVILVTLKREKN
jgi:uncharacterized protein (TIGR03067 family)